MSNIDKKPGKYGTSLKDLRESDPDSVQKIIDHHGNSIPNIKDCTPGEVQYYDIDYGQADPRVEAAQKALGDVNSKGGSGPKRKQ